MKITDKMRLDFISGTGQGVINTEGEWSVRGYIGSTPREAIDAAIRAQQREKKP